MAEKPETEAMVKEKLASLKTMWEDLESTTQTKAKCLFDANKAELFTQSCADLDKWMAGLEGQLQSDDYGKDLTSVNILLKKQQVRSRASTRALMRSADEVSAPSVVSPGCVQTSEPPIKSQFDRTVCLLLRSRPEAQLNIY